MQYFPNKLCSACYIKAKVYYEYKQKTYCAGEVIKQVAEEQKSNERIMCKLANVCRICLNTVQPARSINIFENEPVLGWLNSSSEVKLEETADLAKWICSKCARKVHINLEFKVLVAQSLEYLKGILELSDDLDAGTTEASSKQNISVDEEEEEEEETITVPVPVKVVEPEPEVKCESPRLESLTKSINTEPPVLDDVKEELLEADDSPHDYDEADYDIDDHNDSDNDQMEFSNEDNSRGSEVFTEQFPLLKCEVEINFDESLIKEEEEVELTDINQEELPMQIDFNETGKKKKYATSAKKDKKEEIQKEKREKKTKPRRGRKVRKRKSKKRIYSDTDDTEENEEEEKQDDEQQHQQKEEEDEEELAENPEKEEQQKAVTEKVEVENPMNMAREVKRDFKYNCTQCARRFSVQWIYNGHMRTHQGDAKPYHCPHCSKKYGQQSQLYRHLYDVHDVPQKPRVPAAVSAQIEYKCEFCCKIFKRQDHYRDHVDSVHHLIRRFKCSYCERSFSLARTMRLHEMRHTGECPYVCETCGRRFRKTTDLKLHMHKHMFPPELICSICHRGKNTAEELAAHVAEHEFKMRHQCPKCGMLFKRASHLVQHDKAVHLKIRPYKCRYCDKAFALHGTTLAHERVHTGERPQICSICGVTYKTKRGLQAHVKRHESEEDPKAPIPKGRRKERKKKPLPENLTLPMPVTVQLNTSTNPMQTDLSNQQLQSSIAS